MAGRLPKFLAGESLTNTLPEIGHPRRRPDFADSTGVAAVIACRCNREGDARAEPRFSKELRLGGSLARPRSPGIRLHAKALIATDTIPAFS